MPHPPRPIPPPTGSRRCAAPKLGTKLLCSNPAPFPPPTLRFNCVYIAAVLQ